MSIASNPSPADVSIRPLEERDVPAADRIFRLAFGTFLGLPDPLAFTGDAELVRTRWRATPHGAFAATVDGELVGSNFATHWGSVGFFGPLSVHPDWWNRGVGQRLVPPMLDCFAAWGVEHAGLFTFSNSLKHLGLYQKFGFYPRFLTALLAKSVAATASTGGWSRLSSLSEGEQAAAMQACHEVTDAVYAGLDVSVEIQTVLAQQFGETVLLWNRSQLAGFAVCHCGAGSEAGSGACYIKFGAVLPGTAAAASFEHLLLACESLAAAEGAARLEAGANLAREEAYHRLLAFGFKAFHVGVAMERPNEPGYNRSGMYLIDDWR